MQTKLQELTEKIYQEGVSKANEEAEKILSEAKKEAASLVANARKEAESLKKAAEKEAEELKKNSLNELQLSARQAISDLKQKVVGLIETKAIKPETRAAFKEAEFTRDVIRTVVKNWNPESGDAVQLEVVLPKEKQKELEAYFRDKAKELLDKGLELKFSEKLKGGFKIGPKEGGYTVSFSDEDFENFFQAYLRPKLIELLFQEK
jgi:V/A-type H+/Na+-transporting ATPase subunit E